MRFVDLIRWADDFPIDGVRFADLSLAFTDAAAFGEIVDGLAGEGDVDLIAGVDARGFLLAGGVGSQLGLGVLAVRKAGKLPPPVRQQSYQLEYATATLEIPEELDLRGRRVLLIDDVLATGGTLSAAAQLLRAAGAASVTCSVILELAFLAGRNKLGATGVEALHVV